MGAADGRETVALSETLLTEPSRFDFFQAVRLLERLAREQAHTDPRRQRAPVGFDGGPDEEVVRFKAQPALSFAGGDVARISRRDGDLLDMAVTFLGLTGPQGVLPPHYTALLLQRLRAKDFALRDFFDLFNHRVVSLFFRAWEKYRLPFAYERAQLEGGGADPVTTLLHCLIGLGTGGLRGRRSVADEAFLFYAGHFAHQPRNASALEAMLQDYFGVPARVNQGHGQWLTLELDDRSVMPTRTDPEPHNCQLGVNLVAGERVWDVQSKFRVQVGPVNYEQFGRFLPGGEALRALAELTRSYVGPEYDFDVVVLLLAEEVPWCRLQSGGAYQPRLGWNTWVRCGDMEHVVDDAVFDLSEA